MCKQVFTFLLKSKYCACHGFILVDTKTDLFQPFQIFIVKAVDFVLESYASIPQGKVIIELENWKECKFNGTESFLTVCDRLKNPVMTLLDYVTYVQSLPQMKLLFRYSYMMDLPCVFISLLMSFDTFSLFNKQTYYFPDEYEEVTSHKLTCGEDNILVPTKLFCSPVWNGVLPQKSDSPSKVTLRDVPEECSKWPG